MKLKLSLVGELLGLTHEPEIERMVIGDKFNYKTVQSSSHERAVLESVSINLEAGIAMVDKQETALAKIEGNSVRLPSSESGEKVRTSG